MHQVLSTEYWPNISHVEASRIIKQTFPSITTKRKSKAGSKKTVYLGIRKRSVPISTGTESLSADPADTNSSPESITPDLKSLHLELNRVLSSDGILVHGPDTISNFEGFSLSSLLAELRQLASGLVEFCISLGDTHRNADCDDVGVEDALIDNDIKVLVSMCSSLNARSRQMNGLQLLLSLTPDAGGSSNKQTSKLQYMALTIILIVILWS